jgi:hypothetical protein
MLYGRHCRIFNIIPELAEYHWILTREHGDCHEDAGSQRSVAEVGLATRGFPCSALVHLVKGFILLDDWI